LKELKKLLSFSSRATWCWASTR